MVTLVGSCLSSSMQDCSAALLGPYCADPFGVPRYSATIWIDFLNGHLASSTRGKYAAAANALYHQAERMAPPIDLDAALLSADLSSLEAVLSANLLSGADSLNGQSRWRLSKQFVFSILENVVRSDTAELGRELRRIKRLYAQLRPPGRRPNVRLRAIPAVALEELYEVFRPDSVRNPFRTDALKWRNFVILLVLTQLGLRKGEVLSLSVSALQTEFDEKAGGLRHWLSIDGSLLQQDTRARQASLKNGPAMRQLPISLALLTALDTYVSQFRGDPPHAFLFSSLQDGPLAASTLDQIIATAVDCLSVDAVDAIRRHADGKLSAHSFRHTAAVIRLQRFMSSGMEHDEAIRRLRPFFGWSRDSEMPFHYARAYFDPRYAQLWDEDFEASLAALREGVFG